MVKKAKFTQQEIAEKLKMTQANVSYIFSGKPIGKYSAKLISAVTGKPWKRYTDPDIKRESVCGDILRAMRRG